jgi:hypothetical protein
MHLSRMATSNGNQQRRKRLPHPHRQLLLYTLSCGRKAAATSQTNQGLDWTGLLRERRDVTRRDRHHHRR